MQNDHELEQLLRKAPHPAAPLGLEQRLIQQASRPKQTNQTPSWTWFSIFQGRNRAPALALFAVLAGLLTALGFQQSTLNEITQAREELAAQSPAAVGPSQRQSQNSESELQQLQKQSVELQALRDEMAAIEQLLAQQPAIAQENAALRAELSSLTRNNPELSPEAQAAIERIKCVNNLKNVGLAARIWATDNGDKNQLPKDFLTMKNELGTPNILICPSDPSRGQGIENWDQFNTLGSSYEILSPGISEQIPTAAYTRCPIHNNVGRADGSVLQLRADQQLIQRDGHLEIGE